MDYATGTNAPPAMFCRVVERESFTSTMADFDGDGIPNVYEIHNETDPYVADAALAPRLSVGPSNDYATISAALAASTNYSIVSVAAGACKTASPIAMPPHPVMLVCEDGYAVVECEGGHAAFLLAATARFSPSPTAGRNSARSCSKIPLPFTRQLC